MERINEWLKQLAQNNGSDLYLSAPERLPALNLTANSNR